MQSSARTHSSNRDMEGVVLLEVILALALFAATAAIVTTGINSSIKAVERLRLGAHATDLAITVNSEIQLGDKPATVTEPEPFTEPFTNWTWQVVSSAEAPIDPGDSFQHVEVVIRHIDPPYVFRFGEILPVSPTAALNAETNLLNDL